MTEIITRAAARARGLKFYFTGESCVHGHVSKRYASNGKCSECQNAQSIAWNTTHLDKKRARDAARAAARSRDERRAKNVAFYAKNRDQQRARAAAWRAEHREKSRASARAYKKAHPEWRRANEANRHAAKLQATPPWADLSAIRAVHEQTAAFQQLIGSPYHTDHVVPLQGANFSGLNVHYNLRPFPGAENIRKSNRLTGDDLQLAWPNDPVVNRMCTQMRKRIYAHLHVAKQRSRNWPGLSSASAQQARP